MFLSVTIRQYAGAAVIYRQTANDQSARIHLRNQKAAIEMPHILTYAVVIQLQQNWKQFVSFPADVAFPILFKVRSFLRL
jgi:hypothetical protein